jgi:hypothetical protein
MIFKQHKNGSCDIEFSWKERLILLKKGKLHLSDEAFKHFSNVLMKMVMDWNMKFNDELKKKLTYEEDKIDGR